jgi:hypothetical protein
MTMGQKVKSPAYNSCAPGCIMMSNVAPSNTKYRLMYSARLLSLIVITVTGTLFLMWLGLLLWLLHKMPGIITREDVLTTVVLGSVSACFGALYVFLLRKTDGSN